MPFRFVRQARLATAKSEFRRAVECYRAALRVDPDNLEAHAGLANVCLASAVPERCRSGNGACENLLPVKVSAQRLLDDALCAEDQGFGKGEAGLSRITDCRRG